MQFVLIGSLGVLALGSLALVQTAAQAPVPAPVGDYSIERPFAEGGRVRLQLASGDYTVRAGASDRIVVRWDAAGDARVEDLKKLEVDVHVAGSMATIVTDGPTKHMEFTIELPSRSDVHLRMRAGEVDMTGIEGHKNIRMTAGELTIGVRARIAGERARVGHVRRPRRPRARHLEERHQALARLDWRRHLCAGRPPRRRRPHPDRKALAPKWSCTCAALQQCGCCSSNPAVRCSQRSGPRTCGPSRCPRSMPNLELRWSSSREEYDAARADERYAFEQFTYESDGLTVGAYLYRPRKRSASPLPVIVYNRGSYTRPSGFAGEMLVMANRYGRAGFIVDRSSLSWQQRVAGTGRNGWSRSRRPDEHRATGGAHRGSRRVARVSVGRVAWRDDGIPGVARSIPCEGGCRVGRVHRP